MRIRSLAHPLVITLLVFASLGLSVTLLEVATGYLYERAGLANGKRMVDLYLGRTTEVRAGVTATRNASIAPHPYLLFVQAPNMVADGYQQTNSLGYRNKEFTVEKPADTIRIVVLGGSTTFMWPYVKNPADTWVARLEAKLQAISSKRVQVVNAGISYGTSAESLAGYVFRHRFLQPDIVIYHGGGNDVLPLFFEHYNPEYTHFRSAGSGSAPRPGEQFLLANSNTVRYLYARWLESVGSVVVTKPFWKWTLWSHSNGSGNKRRSGLSAMSRLLLPSVKIQEQTWSFSGFCKREGNFSAGMRRHSKAMKMRLYSGWKKITTCWQGPGAGTMCPSSFQLRSDFKTSGFKTIATSRPKGKR